MKRLFLLFLTGGLCFGAAVVAIGRNAPSAYDVPSCAAERSAYDAAAARLRQAAAPYGRYGAAKVGVSPDRIESFEAAHAGVLAAEAAFLACASPIVRWPSP